MSSSTSSDLNFFEVKKGIKSWLFTLDHKRIGLMYFYAISSFFLVGVVLGLLMRLELIAPGETIMKPTTYNQTFTLHGVIMIFLFIIPGIPAIFGNFFLPLLLGTDDVAFPRLNLISWYLYVGGAIFALLTLGSWQWTCRYRMDVLCSIQCTNRYKCHHGCIGCIHPWVFIDTHRLKLYCYYTSLACSWDGLVRDAFIRMGTLCNLLDSTFSYPCNWDYPFNDRC